MSIPEKHHFLPQFYLDRWAVNGKVFRYARPRGPAGPLDGRWKAPAAVAYERNLYQLPDISDPMESQQIELQFFQQIDDRAAKAIARIETGERGTIEERVALSQFMVSLMHRSPSRLEAIRADLAANMTGAPFEGQKGQDFDNSLKATANRLLQALVGNANAESVVSKFDTYAIRLRGSRNKLITSDRPITLSPILISPDAFMALPIAPDCLLLLARDAQVARSFATQNPSVLVEGINQAVVEQSVDVVIAADTKARAMVDRLFLRQQPGRVVDTLGFIRRHSPYRDLRPKVREFSRHNKNAMRYLGS